MTRRGIARRAAALLVLAAACASGAGRADGEQSIEPIFVRPLFAGGDKGYNDSNPLWSPSGELIAFERAQEARREIVIARPDGAVLKTVYYKANADSDELGLGNLLPGLGESASYNAGLAWSPEGKRFVFMSNAGEGNYDLYQGSLASDATQRLTDDPQKDGQPHWSPAGSPVVFVSGRDGGAQLFLVDPATRQTRRISDGEKAHLYPRWSPDGKRIVAIYGANENHDILLIENLADPAGSRRLLTTWRHDDLSPAWSPDGTKIAFYTNQNSEDDPKVWALAVVDAAGDSPTAGDGLAARIVARNVLPDVAMGPAWLPDSRRIAYVRNDQRDYSPVYIVDVETHESRRLRTGTNINRELSCSSQGVLAFRAQVDQWDRIFLAKVEWK